MNNRNPQNVDFLKSKNYSIVYDFFGILIFVFSIIQLYFEIFDNRTFFVISSVILILQIYFNFVRDSSFEKAHYVREMALLDNSFNEKRIPNYDSGKYFNNEEIKIGEIKLLANIHENTLFTMNITAYMLVFYKIIVGICSFVVLVSIFYDGINDYTSILLSFILTSGFFRKLLEIRTLNRTSEELFNKINLFCSDFENNITNEKLLLSKTIDILLQYENVLHSTKVVLSGKIFRRLNKDLSYEWEEIKSSYSIYKYIDN